jgi:hypothetical protein
VRRGEERPRRMQRGGGGLESAETQVESEAV